MGCEAKYKLRKGVKEEYFLSEIEVFGQQKWGHQAFLVKKYQAGQKWSVPQYVGGP